MTEQVYTVDADGVSTSPFGDIKDLFFMNKALALARKARHIDEVPIGAVVVDPSGVIVGRGFNQTEKRFSQKAHAEMSAIEKATRKIGNWRLEGCWLYVTLQPCAMCMGLIRLSRLAGVVYGAESPLFGYHLDNVPKDSVYKRDILAIRHGLCAQQSIELLQGFFQKKRKKSDDTQK